MSRDDEPYQGLESPYLDGELFIGESANETSSRFLLLDNESPFRQAFLREDFETTLKEHRSRIDESLLEEEETKDEECKPGRGIIGEEDNRVPLSKKQTLLPAYRWICQISGRKRRNGEMLPIQGTGVLISPRHVLTAAHLLRDSEKDVRGQWVDKEADYIVVTPARNGDQRPFGKYEAESWKTSPKYDPRDKDPWKYDYGIIRLKEAVGSKTFPALKNRQLCYWGSSECGRNTFLELVEVKRLDGKTGYTAGYPGDGDKGSETMWFAKGKLSGVDIKVRREVMSIEADACHGQSGSPVWINEKGKRYLVGVLTKIGTGMNSAVRINQEVIDQISKWFEAATETPYELDAQESLERIEDSEVEEALDEEVERPADASFSQYGAVPLDVREAFDEQIESPSGKTSILSTNISKGIADAVQNNEWPLALMVAIEEGWRDHNKLTSLLFYARHPELEGRLLDRDDPKERRLRREWINIRDDEVWPAIQKAAKNVELVVSGNDVTQWDQKFWDKSGREFRSLVEWAAKEVDINPGLLAATLLAEESERKIYLAKARVSSYQIGVDDFYERREKLKEKVPAYTKVDWDKKQKPEVHLNDAKNKNNRREIKTIRFDSGRDGLLASAVYLKYGEIVLREDATGLGKDFDALPVETRFALIRIAFAGGPGAAKTFLGKVLEKEDILVREDIPLKKYQTQRNATIRAAQAMHLSEWVFGVPTKATIEPEVETSEAFDEDEGSYESDAEIEEESGEGSEELEFEDAWSEGEAEDYEDELDLEHLGITEFQVGMASNSPTLGFEFDLNFGFEEKVTDATPGLFPPPGFNWPSEGLKVTDHEWMDGTGNWKDAFVVTLDAVRMEIATAPFHIDDDSEFNTIVDNVKKFGQELIDAKKKRDPHLVVPGVDGNPTTFEHPRTVVNKPEVDADGNVKYPGDRDHASYNLAVVPLVIHRVSGAYPTKTELWSSPQATLTLPLAEFGKLVWEIHFTRDGAPGEAFTGRTGRKGRHKDRLGLRDDLAWLALTRAVADRKKKLGTALSDGTKVTEADFTRSITCLVTILVMYMLTSIKKDPRDEDKESYAKGSLPLNVKTPLWQIHKFALTDREKFVFHELYTDPHKRANLFALASGKTGGEGARKLFPDYTHWDAERFLGTSPTWHTLIDAVVKEKPVIVTVEDRRVDEKPVAKKGHLKGDQILIAPLTSKLDWDKTKQRIAVEMRRLGFAPVGFKKWPGLMERLRKLAQRVNP